MIDNLLSLQIKAIEKLKLKQEEIAQSLESFSNNFNSISEDKIKINNNIQSLRNELSNISIQIDNKIKDVLTSDNLYRLVFNEVSKQIKEIPTPKDGKNGNDGINGKDAIIDYDLLNKYINDKIDLIEIPKAEKVEYNLIEKIIKNLVNEFVSNIKNGIDGRDGLDGKDGIGIKDIKDNKSFFEIILDNGIKKKILKPLDMVKSDLSGGIDFKTINGISIVGKGDIPIESGTGGVTPTTNYTNIFYNSLL